MTVGYVLCVCECVCNVLRAPQVSNVTFALVEWSGVSNGGVLAALTDVGVDTTSIVIDRSAGVYCVVYTTHTHVYV